MRQIIRLCCGLLSGDIGDPIMSDDGGKFVFTLIRPNIEKKMYKDRRKMVNLLLHDFRINVLGLDSFLTPKEVDNLVTRLATFWNIPAPHYELLTRLQRASCHEVQMKSEIFLLQTGTLIVRCRLNTSLECDASWKFRVPRR